MSEAKAPSSPKSTGAGLVAVILAVTGFSWGFPLVKAIPLPAATIGFFRVAFGVTFLVSGVYVLKVGWPKQRWAMVIAGVAFGAHQILYIAATKLTSIAIVTVIGATMPLLITAMTFRGHDRRGLQLLVGSSFLAIAGVVIIVYANRAGASRSLLGDLLAVLNVFTFVAYFLAGKHARSRGAPTLSFTAGAFCFALLTLIPALFFVPRVKPTGAELGLLAFLALGPGNGHLLLNWAHGRLSAALSSLVLAMVPALAGLWAYLLFDEPLTGKHLLGMLLVILAIEGGRRAEGRRARAGAPS